MWDPVKRYQELGLRDSLTRSFRYPSACKELSFIIRAAFHKFPKNLQSLIHQDVITAFHLLPDMQTSSAVSAAHLLLQSVEATLPKQKRNSAIVEFKQAMVAHKRRGKLRQEEKGSAQLPQDVLIHIFSLLDIQSLLSVGLVCRSWNIAAGDEHLWQAQNITFFGGSDSSGKLIKDKDSDEGFAGKTYVDWKEAFKRAYAVSGNSSRRKIYGRGYCKHCMTIVYINNMRCPRDHGGNENKQIKPLSQSQVVEYLLNGSSEMISSSDSDSDSDEVVISEFWALPKYFKQIASFATENKT